MRRGLRNQFTLLRLLVPDSELEIAWEALPAVRVIYLVRKFSILELMETPGRAFFQWRSARGRRSGRRRQSRNPWQEPKEENFEEEGQGDSLENVDLVPLFKPKKRKRERVIIDNSQYDKMPICGIEVRLPVGLKPYPSQKLMMVRIITALNKRLNLLAESPTGSGKTMALLASSCAWIQDYKKKRHEATAACPVHSYRVKGTDTPGIENVKQEVDLENIKQEVGVENIKQEIVEKPTSHTPRSETSLLCESISWIVTLITLRSLSVDYFSDDDEFVNDFASSPSVQQGILKNGTPPEKAPPKECICLPKVRIYYGTRTHKQIGQVVKEFSRLPYGGLVLHTILASREQSCINMAARESRDISAYCRELLSAGGIGCRYKEAMKSRYLIAPNLRHVLEQTGSVVFDIEGLVESLSSLSSPLCPYFSSTRVLTIDADIIFCPFSYLVDPIIRDSSDVRLKHSVVILDEAHNIEDTCREAASFTFYEKEISDSLVNLRDKENTTLKLIEKSSNAAELMDGMEKETANASIEAYSLELERITALVLLVSDISKWFRDSAPKLLQYAKKDEFKLSYTVNHGYLEVDLKRFHLHPDDPRYQIVEPAYKGLVASYQDPKENRTVDNKVGSVALICVEKWLYFIGYFKDENKRSMYKLNVCSEKVYQFHERGSYIQGDGRRDGQSVKNINYSQMTGDESDVWLSSTQGPGGHDPIRSGYRTSFNLWCMCPELAFADAFSECRSVILASGTLCPVETLKTELGLKFHSQMEGEQVIPSEQIFASVLPMGPSGHRLCATYRNVNEENSPFVSELALTIRTICLTVPKGILCFFPSYRMLTLVFEYMETSSILRQIQHKKAWISRFIYVLV
ncbi:hypothetical protein Y032_0327g2615 [Ancylostoma ceylanicum]|uniref:Helicase ATP-binding domain-containing protein n=2 Tax=Ancylostoma ceylanicum TaxID=53326 RepID=A0A016S068_9BILA|nr:hypothetical protein Y032_0327g2615 [Ancylostoma ceylanicum]